MALGSDRYLLVGGDRRRGQQSAGSRFAIYAVIILIPVVVLGVVLAANYRTEAQRRGLSEGRSEATLMAQTAVEPLLDGRPLSAGLDPAERHALQQMTHAAVASGNVRRFRLRDLTGAVVFSDDGSGFQPTPGGRGTRCAGRTAGRPAHPSQLRHRTTPVAIGSESVEVYLPLQVGSPAHRVGVLEVYLPYAPINADVDAGLNSLYRNLAIGLGALYVILFGVSLSVTRRLRRQVKLNRLPGRADTLTGLPNRTHVSPPRPSGPWKRPAGGSARSPSPSSTSTASRRSTTPSVITTATGS